MDSVPPRRHPRPQLAHGVAHRLPGGRGADPLPPRLSAYRRPQPDPRQRPRAGCHAPDRTQEPRHLRPLQHHQRAGTARRRGPAGRLSGAAGAGGASPAAAPRGRHCRPAPRPSASCDAAPRKSARPPGTGAWPGAAVAGHRTGHRYDPASDRGTRSDGAGRRRRTRARPGPGCGCMPEGWMPLADAGPHPPAGRRRTVAASGLMPGGRAARDEDGIHETGHAPSPCGISPAA